MLNELSTLQSFFKQYGWKSHLRNNKKIVTGWQGEKNFFFMEVELSTTILSFRVQLLPLISFFHTTDFINVFEYLLKLNTRMHGVKIGLSTKYQLIMSFDVLTHNFHYQHFEKLLGILGFYCDLIYGDLLLQGKHYNLDS